MYMGQHVLTLGTGTTIGRVGGSMKDQGPRFTLLPCRCSASSSPVGQKLPSVVSLSTFSLLINETSWKNAEWQAAQAGYAKASWHTCQGFFLVIHVTDNSLSWGLTGKLFPFYMNKSWTPLLEPQNQKPWGLHVPCVPHRGRAENTQDKAEPRTC